MAKLSLLLKSAEKQRKVWQAKIMQNIDSIINRPCQQNLLGTTLSISSLHKALKIGRL